MLSATKEELLFLADQQAYARSRYHEDDADLIRESLVIEQALRLSAQQREPVSDEWSVDDSRLLRRAIANCGMAGPDSVEALGFEHLRWVRRIVRIVAERGCPAAIEITSSDGGVEGHATASGSGPLPDPILGTDTVGRQQELKRTAGIKPGPSEAIADVSVDELLLRLDASQKACFDAAIRKLAQEES